ncbi:uncharacterized protein PSFLO_01110 [Pseudozyma flocculosa]|uniref:Chromo domain-containing protein n=1 Tax=Pseudozyma flocculosa TaxID=84751 RepID=A0A5C3EWV3_9BASI|nr:uncharacterized protein PSFLO_01110 [Pseudozyma flocculosa]
MEDNRTIEAISDWSRQGCLDARLLRPSDNLLRTARSTVTPVFHVSLLEPVEKPQRPSDQAPAVTWAEDEREEYEVEAIIDSRRGFQRKLEYLVKWVGYEEPSWIPATAARKAPIPVQAFHQKFPRKPAPARR